MDHLAHIDAQAWPGLVRRPQALLMGLRAQRVHDSLEDFLHDQSVVLDSHALPSPDITPESAIEEPAVLDPVDQSRGSGGSSDPNASSDPVHHTRPWRSHNPAADGSEAKSASFGSGIPTDDDASSNSAAPQTPDAPGSLRSERESHTGGRRQLVMSVHHGTMINRMVDSGFLGLGESYLAGEWNAEPLADVLAVLLDHELESPWAKWLSRWSIQPPQATPRAGDIPLGLVNLSTGATNTWGSPIFDLGSSTTISHPMDWNGHKCIVDETIVEAPSSVTVDDVDSAQLRRVNEMLDHCGVGPGSRVLEFPASSSLLATTAAGRGATVDVLTSDPEYADAIRESVKQRKLAGAIHVEKISGPVPNPRQWSGSYDAIVSVERMETLGSEGLRPFLRAIDRMLAEGGRACIQSVVDTGLSDHSRQALELVRGYVWPALEYPTVSTVRENLMRYTSLVPRQDIHCGPHLQLTLPLWRRQFAVNRDQAAAQGFDRVYRRLWNYVLALEEALLKRGELDLVQFVVAKARPIDR